MFFERFACFSDDKIKFIYILEGLTTAPIKVQQINHKKSVLNKIDLDLKCIYISYI